MTRMTGTLRKDLCTFMVISRLFLLRMRTPADKDVKKKIKTHILCSIFFFENSAFYEIMWENLVEQDRPQATIEYDACALHAG